MLLDTSASQIDNHKVSAVILILIILIHQFLIGNALNIFSAAEPSIHREVTILLVNALDIGLICCNVIWALVGINSLGIVVIETSLLH